MAGSGSRALVDLTPLRHSPAFARLWFSALLTGIGAQLTLVAVGLQVFAITQDTVAVALVGGIALVPVIITAPFMGMLADAVDRRALLMVLAVALLIATAGVLTLSLVDATLAAQGERVWVWPFYIFTTLGAMASIALGAVRGSIVPRILPAHLVPSASALNGLSYGAQFMIGPALAGILVAAVGFGWTFALDLILGLAAFLGIALLPKLPPHSDAVRPGWTSIRQSLAFLRTAPQITAGFLADLIAMTFGRPYVLLPALGASFIGGGAVTVGLIMTSGAVGTFLIGLFSGPVKDVRRHGIVIGRAIQVYGVFVMLFGVTVTLLVFRVMPRGGVDFSTVNVLALLLACLAFAGMGAADEVSTIFRTSMLATEVPDNIRGRMQGIFFAVVNGGPRVGDLYAGLFVGGLALWFPPLLGGVIIISLMGLLTRLTPALRNYVFEPTTL